MLRTGEILEPRGQLAARSVGISACGAALATCLAEDDALRDSESARRTNLDGRTAFEAGHGVELLAMGVELLAMGLEVLPFVRWIGLHHPSCDATSVPGSPQPRHLYRGWERRVWRHG